MSISIFISVREQFLNEYQIEKIFQKRPLGSENGDQIQLLILSFLDSSFYPNLRSVAISDPHF
jgi:hypothetical protein